MLKLWDLLIERVAGGVTSNPHDFKPLGAEIAFEKSSFSWQDLRDLDHTYELSNLNSSHLVRGNFCPSKNEKYIEGVRAIKF